MSDNNDQCLESQTASWDSTKGEVVFTDKKYRKKDQREIDMMSRKNELESEIKKMEPELLKNDVSTTSYQQMFDSNDANVSKAVLIDGKTYIVNDSVMLNEYKTLKNTLDGINRNINEHKCADFDKLPTSGGKRRSNKRRSDKLRVVSKRRHRKSSLAKRRSIKRRSRR
jgi:hypothetical protein